MRILGVDYGEKKVGLALGDLKTGLIEPLGTLTFADCKSQIKNLTEDHNVQKVVIGLPGSRLDQKVRDFGLSVGQETNLPVVFYDETLTTFEAGKILGRAGRTRKYKKRMEDAIAAAVMLKSYLEKEEGHV